MTRDNDDPDRLPKAARMAQNFGAMHGRSDAERARRMWAHAVVAALVLGLVVVILHRLGVW